MDGIAQPVVTTPGLPLQPQRMAKISPIVVDLPGCMVLEQRTTILPVALPVDSARNVLHISISI